MVRIDPLERPLPGHRLDTPDASGDMGTAASTEVQVLKWLAASFPHDGQIFEFAYHTGAPLSAQDRADVQNFLIAKYSIPDPTPPPTYPPVLDTVEYWFDAQNPDEVLLGGVPAAENDPVDEWRNRNSAIDSFLQSTAANRPQLIVQNSVRGLTGDGVSKVMLTPERLSGFRTADVFAVIRHNTVGVDQTIWSMPWPSNPTFTPLAYWWNNDTIRVHPGSGPGTGYWTSSQAGQIDTLYLLRLVYDIPVGPNRLHWNGSAVADPSYNPGATDSRSLEILSRRETEWPSQSSVCEVIVKVDALFTAQEATDITDYLLAKYPEITPQP